MDKAHQDFFNKLSNRRAWRTATLFALIIATTTLTSCASSKKKQEESLLRLRLGTSLLQAGEYPQALRELLLAEKLDPKNEVTQNNLGLAYFMREKYELAAQHLRKAVDLKSDYTEAQNNLARTLIELAQYNEAIAILESVLKDLTYADPAKAWINLGLTYFRKGDYKTAREKFAEAIKVERGNCLGHTLYGRSILEMKDYQNASNALDNAVVVCRAAKFDEPYYFSGLSYYKLGRTSAAVARMEEVLNIAPDGEYAKKAQSLLKLMK